MTNQEWNQKTAILIVKILDNASDRNDYEGFCAALVAADHLQSGRRVAALRSIKPFLYQYVGKEA